MSHTSRTAVLVGMAMAAGVFGGAAMASAPTARADDFTDILNGVEADFTDGQLAFAAVATDLSSNNAPGALAEFFTGVDEDSVLASDSLYLGTVQALTGEPISNAISLGIGPVSDLANGLAAAQGDFGEGETLFTAAATALSGGDYSTAALDQALGSLFSFTLPVEDVFMGAAGQFGI
jgi:hypothetical protein